MDAIIATVLTWLLHAAPLTASYFILKWSVTSGIIKIEENEKMIHKIIAYGKTLIFSFFICFWFYISSGYEDDILVDKSMDYNKLIVVFIMLTIGGLIGVYRGRQIIKKKNLLRLQQGKNNEQKTSH